MEFCEILHQRVLWSLLTCFTFDDIWQQKWKLYAKDYVCFLHVVWTQCAECLLKGQKYIKKSCMKNKNAHFIPCSIFLVYLTVSEIFKQSELIYQNFYAVCTFSDLLVILCLNFAWISWQQHFALINFKFTVQFKN